MTRQPVSSTGCFSVSSTRTTHPFSLVLETWSEGAGVSTWRYALVRQGAGEYSALLDGKPVWSVPAAGPPADAGLFIVRQMSASPAEQDRPNRADVEGWRATGRHPTTSQVIDQDSPDPERLRHISQEMPLWSERSEMIDGTSPSRSHAPPRGGRWCAMVAALIGPAASAQEEVNDRDQATRLEALRRVAKGLKVCEVREGKPGPPLALRPEPFLASVLPSGRWSMALWGWGERGRPSVLMKVVRRGPRRDQLHWHANVSVLSPRRVEVEFRDGVRWSSRLPGLELRSFPDAPAPAGLGGPSLHSGQGDCPADLDQHAGPQSDRPGPASVAAPTDGSL